MDGNGARELSKRIEQHEHWLQADAVRDGRQPASDPDAADLERIEDGFRVYAGGLCKRLLDGRWKTVSA